MHLFILPSIYLSIHAIALRNYQLESSFVELTINWSCWSENTGELSFLLLYLIYLIYPFYFSTYLHPSFLSIYIHYLYIHLFIDLSTVKLLIWEYWWVIIPSSFILSYPSIFCHQCILFIIYSVIFISYIFLLFSHSCPQWRLCCQVSW